MRTYAVATSEKDLMSLIPDRPGGVLVSFAADKRGRMIAAIPSDLPVLIDSGAFSVWTSGKTIDVDEYADYAHTAVSKFDDVTIANLDVIPDGPADVARAARAGAKNAQRLRAAGLPVMEVFHMHEPVRTLRAILDRKQPGEMIALGGVAKQRGGPGFPIKRRFCDGAFAYLRDHYGWDALPRVHGFGVSPDGPLGGRSYPWSSVDSTSWASPAQYGVRVDRRGKRYGGRSDPRAGHAGISSLYKQRVVLGWKRLDREFTELWAKRGVRHA